MARVKFKNSTNQAIQKRFVARKWFRFSFFLNLVLSGGISYIFREDLMQILNTCVSKIKELL